MPKRNVTDAVSEIWNTVTSKRSGRRITPHRLSLLANDRDQGPVCWCVSKKHDVRKDLVSLFIVSIYRLHLQIFTACKYPSFSTNTGDLDHPWSLLFGSMSKPLGLENMIRVRRESKECQGQLAP